jgi:transposase-like protein
MEKKIALLRNRIEKREGRRFPRELRQTVVTVCRDWLAAGGRQRELARKLSLSSSTLENWMRRHGGDDRRRARIKRVEVKEDRGGARPVVRLPSGARIEGLTVKQVAELVRALA